MHNYTPQLEVAYTRKQKLILFAKFFNHVWGACSILFELITGYKPPKLKEVARMINQS